MGFTSSFNSTFSELISVFFFPSAAEIESVVSFVTASVPIVNAGTFVGRIGLGLGLVMMSTHSKSHCS